jgi:uncharacterized protein YecE (DUF72 family)
MDESEFRIGISGWTYAPWRGVFYPKGLTQKSELEYASRQLNSIEINGTFYSLQRPASFRKWYDATPDDFVFSLKGPKFLTHMKRLKDIRLPMANFFASGPLLLGKKLGPILWQFPPSYKFNAEVLEGFLQLLPRTSAAASEYAHEHNMADESWIWTEAIAKTKLQYAFEVRHESFMVPEFMELLRKYKAAFVFADTAGKWPFAEDLTGDFVYARLHGSKELYASGYTPEELDRWAARIKLWTKGEQPNDARTVLSPAAKTSKKKSVHIYFDNDIKVHAPYDAIQLAERLK